MIYPFEFELIYSVLGRQQEKSGYNSKTMLEYLNVNARQKPSVFFVNTYTDKAKADLISIKPINRWITENTMYKVYSTFIPYLEKQKAKDLLDNLQGNGSNLLRIPKVVNKRLKYCPFCVREQKPYWNLLWQVPNIKICTKHKCYLLEADTTNTESNKTPLGFQIPREHIKNKDTEYCNDEKAIHLADTMYKWIQFDSNEHFVLYRLLNTHLQDYQNGFMFEISRLYADMKAYYGEECPSKTNIQSVCDGKQYNFVTACYLLDFLNITPEQAYEYKDFDYKTSVKGIYKQVANDLNIGENIVNSVCNQFLKYYKLQEHTGGVKKFDYAALDRKCVEQAKALCKSIYDRGERVTFARIQRELGLKEQQLQKHMPLCKSIIEQYTESNLQYQARKVDFFAKQTLPPYNITSFINGVPIHKQNLIKVYGSGLLSSETQEILATILEIIE